MYRYEQSPIQVVIGRKNCEMTASPDAAIILFFWRKRKMAISAIFSTFEFVHRNVPKNISDHFYYADMHGYYAGFDGLFLPYFYHSLYN